MSKPRYIWWSYVKGMIRQYPALRDELEDLRSQSITAKYDAMPHGSGGDSRQAEALALRALPPRQQKEYESVCTALDIISARNNGAIHIRLIKLVYWDRTHTLAGAARKLHISEITARRWHSEIIYLVAEKYGLYEPKRAKMIPQGQKSMIK